MTSCGALVVGIRGPVAGLLLAWLVTSSAMGQTATSAASPTAIGSILVDDQGALTLATAAQVAERCQALKRSIPEAPGPLNQASPLRRISLRRLEAALTAVSDGQDLPTEMSLLAGLQQVRYVLVDLEHHDIILVGFAEGWRVGRLGFIVGSTTQQPVLLLDDLVTALRAARDSDGALIQVSIEPTAAGLQKLRAYLSTLRSGADLEREKLEAAGGPVKISFAGLPANSRLAGVFVAADLHLKHMSMGLQDPRIPGLSSYLATVAAGGRALQYLAPRWWLAPDWQPILTDPTEQVFELQNHTMKCAPDDVVVGLDGRAEPTARVNPAAEQWAHLVTRKYDTLVAKEAVFAQLHAAVELVVVANLLARHELSRRAGCPLTGFLDAQKLPGIIYQIPRSTSTKVGIAPLGNQVIVGASGAIVVAPREIAERREVKKQLDFAKLRGDYPDDASEWWWN